MNASQLTSIGRQDRSFKITTKFLQITTNFLPIATGITKFPHPLQIDYNGQIIMGVARRVFQLKISILLILSGLFASDCKGVA